MKKIINGKKYDTETAKEVGRYDNGYGYGDFNHYKEWLYQKKTGEFFLYGEGGPMTKYSVSCGNNGWSGGEKIIPMTVKAAKEWAEGHLDCDEYEAIFGEIEEDDTKTTICLSITKTAAETARRIAAEKGISVSALVEQLILNR